MNSKGIYRLILSIGLLFFISACKQAQQWSGQDPIQKVSTLTRPIQKQYVGIFDLGEGIYLSNQFAGARMNGAVLTSSDKVSVLITPENTPINFSPWYAFKVWADEEKEIELRLTYPDGTRHRYYPKLSKDGKNWTDVIEENYDPFIVPDSTQSRVLPTYVTLKLPIGPDTLWVSAQELLTSAHNKDWIDSLAAYPFVETFTVGKSREGKIIYGMKIGEADDSKMNMVLSRQHPPEIPGYLAMKAFVEGLCSASETAKTYRSRYNTYVIPMVNPDGVDLGHWRHGVGGIDLNRDWGDFNQPETQAVRDFMKEKVKGGGKFFFGVDFHSTWEDIYYTINPALVGNMPGLVPKMIENSTQGMEGYEPNIRPGPSEGLVVTSSNFFFHTFGAESLTYEVGDNTPRNMVKEKGRRTAEALMELMVE
ncbi:MAG: M14 family metallopeptidase [Bacteroidota bacterium]